MFAVLHSRKSELCRGCMFSNAVNTAANTISDRDSASSNYRPKYVSKLLHTSTGG